MKEILQQVKEELERAFDHPESSNLDQCISQLANAKAQAGDKAEMIDNVIHAVQHARNAHQALVNAGDESSTNAYGQAARALDQAIESYQTSDNDPI